MAKDPKIVFLDTEFTGEHAATTLVSIGLVTLAGDELSLAFNDYDRSQVTDWLRENVLNQIDEKETVSASEGYWVLRKFLDDYAGNDRLFVVSAGLAQDLVLFLELFKHGREEAAQFHARHDLPEYLGHHAFIDLNTLFRTAGLTPPEDRAAYAGITEASSPHNALEDARVVRACFLKLAETPAGAALIKESFVITTAVTASPLFGIETNEGFDAVPAAFDARLQAALVAFGIGDAEKASRIKKHNRYSELYLIEGGKGRFVLRAFEASHAKAVETQCRIVSELRDVETIRPMRCKDGAFVHCADEEAWMAYPYIAGPLFAAPGVTVAEAIQAALRFLIALRRWQEDHADAFADLPKIARTPAAWDGLRERLETAGAKHLSAHTCETLRRDRGRFDALLAEAQGVHPKADAVVHCDLQHANLVIGPAGPAVIDLEDICIDSMAVSTAHAIFKLARHAVYLGLLDARRASSELVSPMVAWAGKQELLTGDVAAARALAAHRTAGDIHNILLAMENPQTAWVSYDLEKKVNNLFEIGALFGKESECRKQ